MTYINDNIIPGNHGKSFTMDVESPEDKSRLKAALMSIDGVVNVIFETADPFEVTIHTNKVVHVQEITDKATSLELHVIPKGPFFPLF